MKMKRAPSAGWLWPLILTACGGGGGGGGPVVTPPASPVAPPASLPSPAATPIVQHHLQTWLTANAGGPQPATNTGAREAREIIVEWANANTDPIRVGTTLTVRVTDKLVARLKAQNDAVTADDISVAWFRGSIDKVGEGLSFTPTRSGTYYVKLINRHDDPLYSSPGLQRLFFVRAARDNAERQTDVTDGAVLALSVYENRPADSAIVDLSVTGAADTGAGGGTFEMAADDGTPDNRFFRVDSTTGEVFFRSTGDMPLLDHESARDADGNNIYRVKILHRRDDGTRSELTLDITVRDLANEKTDPSKFPEVGLARTIYGRDEALIAGQPTFNELGPVERNILSQGDNAPFRMPDSGPLIITYSIVNIASLLPEAMLTRKIDLLERSQRDGSQDVVTTKTRGELVSTLTDPREMKAARDLVREVLDAFERAANLKFIEVADNAHVVGNIRIAFLHEKIPDVLASTSSYAAGSFAVVGRIPWNENNYPDKKLMMHEIAHVLNLFHPFTSTFDPLYHTPDTIMSYANFPPEFSLPQADINALQFMYGPPLPDEQVAAAADII